MPKPAAYFPFNALPNLQELSQVSDIDVLGITGSITQKADQVLTSGYASSGAIAITITGAFTTWPAFGVVENLTTLEQMVFSRTTNDTLNIASSGRAKNGTAAAAGSAAQSLRFHEMRGLGRLLAQIQAEIVAHDDFLRACLCKNAVVNGNMNFISRGTGAASTGTPAITAAQAYKLDDFLCRPAGAAVTVDQSTTVPNSESEFSAVITGASSVTTVNFGQRVEARIAKRLRRRITFSAMIQNVSGAAFTPKLQIYTPTSINNFGAVNSIALDQSLQQCADNAWTKVSYSFDPSAYTDIAKGFEITIQIPSGSCVAGDTIRVTQFQLEPGSGATVFTDAADLEYKRVARFVWAPDLAGNTAGNGAIATGFGRNTTDVNVVLRYPIQMVKRPSFSASSAAHFSLISGGSAQAVSSFSFGGVNDTAEVAYFTAVAGGAVCAAGDAVLLFANNASARMLFTAEL